MIRALNRRLAAAAIATATAASLAACASGDDVSGKNDSGGDGGGTITVGSADFPESRLLAEIYAQALEGADADVERNFGIGAREVYMQAVEDGSVDVIPEYTGALLTYFDQENTISESQEVYDALDDAMPDNLEVLEMSKAEDKDALAVTQETADSGVASIADLAGKDFKLGGQAEFETRANGVPGLESTYGVTFSEFVALSTGPLTEQALNDGDIQVAVVFTTQPEVEVNNWVVLEDPESLFVAQNVVPLVNDDSELTDAQEDALNKVSTTLTTEDLTAMVKSITIDKTDVAAEAKTYVDENDLA